MKSSKPLIAVVDYEMGNLHSVGKALEKAGARVKVTSSASDIRHADGVVLPGVGAFGEAAKRLAAKRLAGAIADVVSQNKPFLGICLGLQLLFERSEEDPRARGLEILRGDVIRFRLPRSASLKVPHMGWNTVDYGPAANAPALRGIRERSYFYFVHSYFPAPKDRSIVATTTRYAAKFCSSVAQGRLFASQFHPEKSGANGHAILRNYVKEVSVCS